MDVMVDRETKTAKKTVVQVYGAGTSSCGYCTGNVESSLSYGVVSSLMMTEDYESLMLIGWRRSGTYFYKPIMYATCCPAYTIRLEANNFKISKKQRQVVRRIERFLECDSILQCDQEQCRKNVESIAGPVIDGYVTEEHSDPTIGSTQGSSKTLQKNLTDKPAKKNNAHILTYETTAAEFTTERYELYKKYQVAVHGDNPNTVTPSGFKRFLVDSPLYDSSSSSIPSLIQSESVGETDSTEKSESVIKPSNGLKKENLSDDKTDKTKTPKSWKLGTYHQLHRLDGRLVAVGVVDIIPSGLSSVYLFYDPEEKLLSLGKYTAIKEIEFCVENKLKYYYMGFYIHSCKKMRYKGEYEPSELLCPTALDWHPYKESVTLLEKNKFSPLNKKYFSEFEAILEIQKEKEKEKEKVMEKVEECILKSEDEVFEETTDRDSNHLESAGKNKNKIENKNENKNEKNRRKKSKENDSETDIVKDCESTPASKDQKPDPLEDMQFSPLKVFSPRFNYTHTTSPTSKIKNKNDANFTDSNITDLDRRELTSIPLDLGDGEIYSLTDLTAAGREYATKFLTEWKNLCGPLLSPKVIVKVR